jgi:AraC family transcriptional regulator
MQIKLTPGKLYGRNLKTRQVAGLRLAEVVYSPGYKTPEHSHDLPQLCLVRKGTFAEAYDRKTREVGPLSLITRPAGESHAQRFYDSEVHCLIVEVEHGWLERVREDQGPLNDSAAFHGGLSIWLATRLYKEFQLADEASSLAIEGLALEVMAELSRKHVKPGRKPPTWLKQTKELLHAHFSEPLTLDGIATSIGAHPVHLARVFRQNYHCTIGEYIRKLRIEFACREISVTDSPLALIASQSGFYDQSHFSRTFKRIMEITPGEYRAAFRSR